MDGVFYFIFLTISSASLLMSVCNIAKARYLGRHATAAITLLLWTTCLHSFELFFFFL